VITWILVNAGWVFFRAADISAARGIFESIMRDWFYFITPELAGRSLFAVRWEPRDWVIAAAAIGLVELGDVLQGRLRIPQMLARRSAVLRWCGYFALVLAILCFGKFTGRPFIYFQF
jgi:hypothetical protein